MRITNAIYDNLILLLESVVGPDADAFELTLVGAEKVHYTTIITTIIDELTVIHTARTGELIYSGADLLIQSLQSISSQFPLYLMSRKDEVLTYLTLYKSLIKNWTSFPSFRLRPSIFKIIQFDIGTLIHKNYFYHDTNELKNSVFLIHTTDINLLSDYLDSGTISEVLILYLLAKLDIYLPITNNTFILIKTQRNYNVKEVFAFLKFQMIIEGKFTHQPYEISHVPSNINRTRIKLGNGYHQFADTLMILSEYNYQKDLLDKYLRLYHVLENNMYRSQIVKVEAESLGSAFSIREFQRLYKKISKREEDVLGILFKETFELNYTLVPPVEFKSYLMSKLTNVRAGMTDLVLNEMLTKMNLNINITTINPGSLLAFYTNIVYKFRNAMVHNRETEFHLMHETLSPSIKQFIQQFLIPSMEEMVILLTVERNRIIWYTNSTISVYQE